MGRGIPQGSACRDGGGGPHPARPQPVPPRAPPVGPRTCEVTHTPPGTAISSVSALWDPVGVLTRFFLEGDSGDTGGWCVFSTSQVAPEF